jgi:hypothetical protein
MWDCGEDSGAISGVVVTSTGPAVVHPQSQLLGISHDLEQ